MADRRADQEKGAVLIAVNSYWSDPKRRLLYSDRVLKGYIETFYRYLFFQVDVVVDFTLMDFYGKLKEFTTRCRNNGMNRIAVVLYGHGGIVGGKECILTNDFEPLDIAALEEELHNQLPDDNKYLFIDACRNSVSVQPYVLQANTERTTVIRSTLLFKTAISNAWSECFAMNLRKQGALSIIVNNVDDDMKEKYTVDIRRKCKIPVDGGDQKSEKRSKGPSDDPSFRGEARASNQERIRELTPYLQRHINVAEQNSTAMRTKLDLPPKPILSFLDSPPDDRSNLTGPGFALSSAQGLATANLPPHLPPVAPLSEQSNNPSNQPSAQVTQPSSTSSTQAMAGVTSTSTTGLDAVIASVDEILKYKKDMIAHQKVLGTVLRLGGMTDTILQGPNALNYLATLTAILETWMEDNRPQVTWRDLVTALERLSNFNGLVYNIKKDHTA